MLAPVGDIIQGFQDGTDFFEFELEFEELTVTSSGSNTLIKVADTGELIATVLNVNPSLITAADFLT